MIPCRLRGFLGRGGEKAAVSVPCMGRGVGIYRRGEGHESNNTVGYSSILSGFLNGLNARQYVDDKSD